MRLHDAILFHNELDLLEIRFHELADVVDRFVVVESTMTFRGHPKALVFDQYRRRFEAFADRIDHLVIDDMPLAGDAWAREHHQRRSIARAFVEADRNDLVMVSDADEIPSSAAVAAFRATPVTPAGFVQPVFYGGVDIRSVKPPSHLRWVGTRVARVDELQPQKLREAPAHDLAWVIDPGGWHFSYLGGVAQVAAKLGAYSHSENDRDDVKAGFHNSLRRGEDPFGRSGYTYERVPVSAATHPAHLVANLDRYGHLILGP